MLAGVRPPRGLRGVVRFGVGGVFVVVVLHALHVFPQTNSCVVIFCCCLFVAWSSVMRHMGWQMRHHCVSNMGIFGGGAPFVMMVKRVDRAAHNSTIHVWHTLWLQFMGMALYRSLVWLSMCWQRQHVGWWCCLSAAVGHRLWLSRARHLPLVGACVVPHDLQ